MQPQLGPTVLMFTTIVSLASAIIFGIVPAFRVMRTDLSTPLNQAGKRAAVGRRGVFDRALVALQVALAVLLVSGAALLVQTLRNLRETNLGFDPARRLLITVETRSTSYARQGMTTQVAGEMLRRVWNPRRTIGVVRVAGSGVRRAHAHGQRHGAGTQAPADGDASTIFVGVTRTTSPH